MKAAVATPRSTSSTFSRSLVALIALQLAACGSSGGGGLSGGGWSRFRANEQSTGFVSFDASGNGGATLWTFDAASPITASPAVDSKGQVYVGSENTDLFILNHTGGIVCSVEPNGSSSHSSPALAGSIFVGSEFGAIYALNSDCNVGGFFQTGSPIESSPNFASGTVYFGNQQGTVFAVGTNTATKWSFATGGAVDSSPAVGSDGTVYVGSSDTKLYALTPAGSLKWTFATGGAVESSPAVGADGTIYVGSDDGSLYAVGPDGALHWKAATGGRPPLHRPSAPTARSSSVRSTTTFSPSTLMVRFDGRLRRAGRSIRRQP
jgi:outer membrane protein assembly factor BamB